MSMFEHHGSPTRAADVYSAREIARAAGVPLRVVRERMAAGAIPSLDGTFVAEAHAVEAVRVLSGMTAESAAGESMAPPALLAAPPASRRRTGLPLAVSSALHVAAVLAFVVASSLGLLSHETVAESKPPEPARLVFLVQKGPGGGGGGGGMRQQAPPPKLQMKRPAPRPASRPIPIRRPPPVTTR